MAMTCGPRSKEHSGINVTPLIDVLLVLLIIFMVIQPSVQKGLAAVAPQPSKQHQADPDPQTLVVAVGVSDGGARYTVNGQLVPLADLQPALARVMRQAGPRPVFVQGTQGLDYAAVSAVLDAAQAAGAANIGLLTPATAALP